MRMLLSETVESHPVVRDLRKRLEAKDADLAAKEREIARLRVAVAFGLRELPAERSSVDGITGP